MTDITGWISVHRKLIDSPIYSDSQAVHLWVHLLLSANHKDNSFLHNGKLVTVKRGQLLTGRQSLSIATGINESKVQRLLVLFEELKMIEQQTNSKSRYISITNYDLYQVSEQQVNSTRTAHEQQVNTNNNVNNVNNDNNTTALAQVAGAPSPVGTMPTNRGEQFPIYQTDIDVWAEAYPAVDIIAELKKIKAWLTSNPERRKTSRGMKAFINKWLAKEQDSGRRSAPQSPDSGFIARHTDTGWAAGILEDSSCN